MMSTVLDGLKNAGLMAYEVWWALVLGFAISAIVQAWVPRHRIESALSGSGFGPISKATGLGAASSSCSYAAIAIARSLFEKGASAATALAFQFASTNLVWELGLVLWVLIGWQFTLAEYVGGIVMIALMSVLLRRFVSPRLEERAREHAQRAAAGHQHPAAGAEGISLARAPHLGLRLDRRRRTTSAATGGCCGRRSPSGSSWRGSSACSATTSSTSSSSRTRPRRVKTIENVIAGPIIAVLSFVCSVGQRPPRGGAVVRRDLVRRRDRLHLRRPDRAADRRSPTASTTGPRSRSGSRP